MALTFQKLISEQRLVLVCDLSNPETLTGQTAYGACREHIPSPT